jgi:hypothetical protein
VRAGYAPLGSGRAVRTYSLCFARRISEAARLRPLDALRADLLADFPSFFEDAIRPATLPLFLLPPRAIVPRILLGHIM